MINSQHPSTPAQPHSADAGPIGSDSANNAPAISVKLDDIAKMRADLERLMGKPAASTADTTKDGAPTK